MELIQLLQTQLILPVWRALCALWYEVLLPLGTAITTWIETYMPWCSKFADLVTALFKFRYRGKIYAFMLLVPIFLLLLLISGIRSKIRRRKRRKHHAV